MKLEEEHLFVNRSKHFCDGTGKMSSPMSEEWNEERYFLERTDSEKSDGYGQGGKGGNDGGGGNGPARGEHGTGLSAVSTSCTEGYCFPVPRKPVSETRKRHF